MQSKRNNVHGLYANIETISIFLQEIKNDKKLNRKLDIYGKSNCHLS